MITLLLAAITAGLIAGGKIGEDKAIYGSVVSLLLGAAAGAICAANVAGEKKVIVCLINGAAYFLSCLCMTAIFFNGTYENIWITGLMIIGTSISIGLLVLRKPKRALKVRRAHTRLM